jgi:RNA polymerase sigma-70 factor (ECF subfamily)
MSAEDTAGFVPSDGLFRTTHWSVVLAAREGDGDAAGTSRALETLCRAYWSPLYAYVRRRGFSPADAQDLTQEFFAVLLRRDFLRNIAREKGRFRSFLLTALKNFLASEWHKDRAVKRGGDRVFVSWDELQAEERQTGEPQAEVTPERLFDQRWALAVMQQAMEQLGVEFQTAGKRDQFERLRPFLSREGSREEYAELAGPIGVTAGAVTVAVHRLRRRYGEVLREVVAQTVAGPDEVEEEVRFLADCVSLAS